MYLDEEHPKFVNIFLGQQVQAHSSRGLGTLALGRTPMVIRTFMLDQAVPFPAGALTTSQELELGWWLWKGG